ncbi:phenol hydroxylase subunit [Hydrogenophaga sp. SL48]|jgi:phenol hydroxylase P0 protein|uniref:phenol hydroxylase subunit n=1 Tax=Hydrogenophaga sp. SL48 TaxID=2806347 RepID=UPI001F2092E5|nr:phenol hydroxylase subunit [Hydrogenophaga sp. SL48]UJW80636.1 phenol hydroxylase subunit [Hydrogenophaga sp. SL48]
MTTDTPLSSEPTQRVDVRLKYVRLLERRADGLVSFEFSIGWPELAVELMLPAAAFDDFCARHEVIWRDAPSPDNTTTGDQPR